jgi:hypothetical protein
MYLTPEQLLLKLAKEGGRIVSSGECSPFDIAQAQACRRFCVVDSLGFVHFPAPVAPPSGEETRDQFHPQD